MRILTNVGLPAHWKASEGQQGEATVVHSLWQFIRQLRGSDVVLVDGQPTWVLVLAALFTACPWLRRPLLGSDIVLRQPETWRDRLQNPLQRFLVSRVDCFIQQFADTSGVERYFGVRPERNLTYRFKPNLRFKIDIPPNPDGEYVLCFGRSLRDFDSFFTAMEITGLPGAIAEPDLPRLRAERSRFTRPLDQLPANVRVLPHDPSSYESQAEILAGAKLVVVAMRKACLVATSTPYNAMLLGKCVLVTEGPATHGLFTDEILTMPAEDPAGMARVIARAWDDDQLRRTTAARGYQLALSLGGTGEMKQRLLDLCAGWWERQAGARRARAATSA